MGDQRIDVDHAARHQLESSPRDAAGVRQGAEDVEVAADDGAQVDARQLAAGTRRASQYDTPTAAGQLNRLTRRFGRARELDDQVETILRWRDHQRVGATL